MNLLNEEDWYDQYQIALMCTGVYSVFGDGETFHKFIKDVKSKAKQGKKDHFLLPRHMIDSPDREEVDKVRRFSADQWNDKWDEFELIVSEIHHLVYDEEFFDLLGFDDSDEKGFIVFSCSQVIRFLKHKSISYTIESDTLQNQPDEESFESGVTDAGVARSDYTHTTALLKIQQKVIDKFYYSSELQHPKRAEVLHFIEETSKEYSIPVSSTMAKSIFTITKPDDHNPKKKGKTLKKG